MDDNILQRIKLYEISTALDFQKIEKLKDHIIKLNKDIDFLNKNQLTLLRDIEELKNELIKLKKLIN
jgi:hypothetical protein